MVIPLVTKFNQFQGSEVDGNSKQSKEDTKSLIINTFKENLGVKRVLIHSGSLTSIEEFTQELCSLISLKKKRQLSYTDAEFRLHFC